MMHKTFRRLSFSTFAIILIGSFWTLSCSTPYKGPQSDHFDGKLFKNSIPHKKSLGDLWAVATGGPSESWPEHIKVTQRQVESERVYKGTRVTFINHASFLIQTAGINILTDPIFSERASPVSFAGPKRVRKPGIKLADLPDIDLVLISHDHYDHLDTASVQALWVHNKKPQQPFFVVGLGVGYHLQAMGINRYRELDWGQVSDWGELKIRFVECQHRSGRGLFDHKQTLWGSFIVDAPEARFYVAGDTGYSPHFKRQGMQYGPFSFALLPIGAYEPRWFMKDVHLNPDEAVRAHLDLRSQLSIGKHYGTFKLTYEGINEPEKALAKAMQAHKVSAFRTLVFGEYVDVKASPNPVKASGLGLDDPQLYLAPTEQIDVNHPDILALAQQLTEGKVSQREQAIAIHDYVRDEIAFGWDKKFSDYRASEVLALGRGFCQTKTTLMVALLRAANIPARPLFADINAKVLFGLGVKGEFLDHAYTEVFIDDTWLAVDSYIVEKNLATQIKRALRAEAREFGYGVALEGQSQWNGRDNSFIQFVDADAIKGRQFPLYADVNSFYRYQDASNNGAWLGRVAYSLFYDDLNLVLNKFRQGENNAVVQR